MVGQFMTLNYIQFAYASLIVKFFGIYQCLTRNITEIIVVWSRLKKIENTICNVGLACDISSSETLLILALRHKGFQIKNKNSA